MCAQDGKKNNNNKKVNMLTEVLNEHQVFFLYWRCAIVIGQCMFSHQLSFFLKRDMDSVTWENLRKNGRSWGSEDSFHCDMALLPEGRNSSHHFLSDMIVQMGNVWLSKVQVGAGSKPWLSYVQVYL